MKISLLLLLFILFSCAQNVSNTFTIPRWNSYDESPEIEANQEHPSMRMRYKLIQSKNLDKNKIWKVIQPQLNNFSEAEYNRLYPMIMEKSIPEIQSLIAQKQLSYEELTSFYLYRIVSFENDSSKYLNALISINPNAVEEARKLDQKDLSDKHPVYGMPLLIKDNINTDGIPTTAGSMVLKNNIPADAFIIKKLKENGAIILGKTNLSEWANFICIRCPNGYSALGGQTLNPYGRKKFDTGGSSSGSGVAIAANYAVAAIGTETSGSILSPSSSNSIVGLKPTIGLLSRSGIIPISSHLDTPGPMTKYVIDNAILLSAMVGYDAEDSFSKAIKRQDFLDLDLKNLEGIRIGLHKDFQKDSLYTIAASELLKLGADTIWFEPEGTSLSGFIRLLRGDMRYDLSKYLENFSSADIQYSSIKEIIEFNKKDSAQNIPYGQGQFYGILDETINKDSLDYFDSLLQNNGRKYLASTMDTYDLDIILSVNNRNAGIAAVAKFPALTIPMGYRPDGQPAGVTFISRQFEEHLLLNIGHLYESSTKKRIPPSLFD